MKLILAFSFLFICSISFSQQGGIIGKGHIDESKIDFLKNNYKWGLEQFLILSFRQPKSKCHYDNYKNLGKTGRAILKFGESVEEKNIRNIFISSEEQRVKAYVDFKTTYLDVDDFVLNTFFKKEKSCYGLVVINDKGRYMSLAGEFQTKDVESFIFLLKLPE